ncbi:LuxR C-terminal-related transcriptional regulator [Nonomuraea sp. NBC_01738]|uniref:helix-turn-helix transcriptional regulator n=1 Tax=Nonomuraea sp. NBC_01738 TaxID=2976003 RepID=UPI002E165626|nr:LuxR C-terminal-related transcriptional regulator [Nonomuraea sp. NBC_01738]
MYEGERAELLAAVERTAGGLSTAVVVHGEPGSGKTTLLDGVRATIRISGIEAEAALPYAAVDRLVRPAAALIGDLAPALRDLVLRPREDPHLVGLAVLTLLSDLAPVTVVIDDAHWLDRHSADALLFTARRLDADGVAMVFAAEPGFQAPGLRALVLEPPADAAALLDGVELNPQVRARIVREAQGNPLALVEFARALTPEQRLGQVLPVSVPAAGNAVLARFGHRLATAVPYGSRLLLTLAAAERDGDLATVMSAAALFGLSEDDLAGAEGVLRVSGMRLAFRHPLERSAAYHLVALTERLRVHRALAEASADPIRRLGHLAAATLTPDERVAAELEDLARRADPALAACMLDHAAQISPIPAERARRSSEAARNLLRADDYERALPRLAGQDSVRDSLLAGDEQTALALAAQQIGELRERGTPGELPGLLELYAEAQIAAGRYGEAQAALDEAAEIARATGGDGPSAALPAEIAAIQGDASGRPGLLALGQGRYEEAIAHLRAELRPEAMTVAADLVEAAARADRPDLADLAADPLNRLTAWAEAVGRPWAQAVALRARAFLSCTEEAGELLARAVHLHEGAGRPFEQARTALLFGQWLRRAGRRAESRRPLLLAAEQFDRLGATPWAERAHGELRAAGAPPGTTLTPQDPLGGLTPQERRIIRLAAAGVSNREIAAQLFLSPRTVEYHLYRAYPKLGVTSRHDLRHTITTT